MKGPIYPLLGKTKVTKILSQIEYGEGIAIRWLDTGVACFTEPANCHIRLVSGRYWGIKDETAVCFMDNRVDYDDPRMFFGVWLGSIVKITTENKKKSRATA